MLSSDSGSSDLSDAASLSSDNSLGSGSEDDHHTVKVKMRPQTTTPSSSLPRTLSSAAPLGLQQKSTRTARAHSFSSSDSGGSTDPSSSDLDDDGNGGQGKRPPNHLRASAKYPSVKNKEKKEKRAQVLSQGNSPISLSASQPVYSQDIITATASALASRGISTPSRGRGRGRGRAPLAGHGSRKYDASGATVIDFEDSSQLDDLSLTSPPSTIAAQPSSTIPVTPARSKKEQSIERTKAAKPAKAGTSKPKTGARKVGRPKTVSKDVYCICRGPYDGVEFMIACDRCEGKNQRSEPASPSHNENFANLTRLC